MFNFKSRIFFYAKIVFLAVFVFSAQVFATDNELLDSLVERGVLTSEEAKNIKKQSAEVVVVRSDAKEMSLFARLQMQYLAISADDGITSETKEGFHIRRVYVGVKYKINSAWDGITTIDMLNGTSDEHKLTTTYVRRKIDTNFYTGDFRFGLDADNFGLEDMTSSTRLLTIERSIVTRFFSCDTPEIGKYPYAGYGALKFGADSLGLYTSGYFFDNKKVLYGASITNPESYTIEFPSENRTIPAFWFNVRYVDKMSIFGNEYSYEIGSYSGYSPQGSVVLNEPKKYGLVYGFNPFLKITDNTFTSYADFMFASVEYGRPDGSDCCPFGVNISAEYKLPFVVGQIAPIMRFSYLDTDGRGARLSESVRKSPALYDDFRQYYDKAVSFYFGFNWYIQNCDVRLQLAYERSAFWGEVFNNNAERAKSDAIRMQLQLLF